MIKALTVRNPWAFAIAHTAGPNPKTIENRVWPSSYRDWLAIHAGAALDDDSEHAIARVAELAQVPVEQVVEECKTRGAVVAVARLSYVCGRTTVDRFGTCDCGSWAAHGQFHFVLRDVVALPEPVPCRGYQRLWSLPKPTLVAVRAQWRKAKAA